MNDTEGLKARMAGAIAALESKKTDVNPYDEFSALHFEWLSGWAEAKSKTTKPATKTVPFDSIADFGDRFPIYVKHENDKVARWLSTMDDTGGLVSGGLVLRYDSPGTARWHHDPRTPYVQCKPFTKEVPA